MGGRILVVDDDPDVLDVLCDDLSFGGHIILRAASAQAALDVLDREHVDLILSDLRMPYQSGIELLAAVRRRTDDAPRFALITGYDEISREELSALGGQAVFEKPYRARDLLRAIDQLLAA